jgi:hypothetical protein
MNTLKQHLHKKYPYSMYSEKCVLRLVKEWLEEKREVPPTPISIIGIDFRYKIFDEILASLENHLTKGEKP